VSNKGEIDSRQEAIGLIDTFWVGVGRPWEARAVLQGKLYVAGAISLDSIIPNTKIPFRMEGFGKVGGRVAALHVLHVPWRVSLAFSGTLSLTRPTLQSFPSAGCHGFVRQQV
jgi:hypothetical protein